jgi:hypothetical protein
MVQPVINLAFDKRSEAESIIKNYYVNRHFPKVNCSFVALNGLKL